MIYKVGMLCKHFKGKNLIDKNIYRIEELNVKGSDVDTDKISYTGEGNMLDSDNLVVYSNIFQENKYFVREYEDLAGELPLDKQKKKKKKLRVEPLSEGEIEIVNSKDYEIKKFKSTEEKFKNA